MDVAQLCDNIELDHHYNTDRHAGAISGGGGKKKEKGVLCKSLGKSWKPVYFT